MEIETRIHIHTYIMLRTLRIGLENEQLGIKPQLCRVLYSKGSVRRDEETRRSRREKATAALLRPFWCLIELSIQTAKGQDYGSEWWLAHTLPPTSNPPHQPRLKVFWKTLHNKMGGMVVVVVLRRISLCFASLQLECMPATWS